VHLRVEIGGRLGSLHVEREGVDVSRLAGVGAQAALRPVCRNGVRDDYLFACIER